MEKKFVKLLNNADGISEGIGELINMPLCRLLDVVEVLREVGSDLALLEKKESFAATIGEAAVTAKLEVSKDADDDTGRSSLFILPLVWLFIEEVGM